MEIDSFQARNLTNQFVSALSFFKVPCNRWPCYVGLLAITLWKWAESKSDNSQRSFFRAICFPHGGSGRVSLLLLSRIWFRRTDQTLSARDFWSLFAKVFGWDPVQMRGDESMLGCNFCKYREADPVENPVMYPTCLQAPWKQEQSTTGTDLSSSLQWKGHT